MTRPPRVGLLLHLLSTILPLFITFYIILFFIVIRVKCSTEGRLGAFYFPFFSEEVNAL